MSIKIRLSVYPRKLVPAKMKPQYIKRYMNSTKDDNIIDCVVIDNILPNDDDGVCVLSVLIELFS